MRLRRLVAETGPDGRLRRLVSGDSATFAVQTNHPRTSRGWVPYCGLPPTPLCRCVSFMSRIQAADEAREGAHRASGRLRNEASFHLLGVRLRKPTLDWLKGPPVTRGWGTGVSTVTNQEGYPRVKGFRGPRSLRTEIAGIPCPHIRLDTTTRNRRRRLRISGCPSHPTIVAEGSPISSLIDLQPGRQRHQDIGRWALPRDLQDREPGLESASVSRGTSKSLLCRTRQTSAYGSLPRAGTIC